jgi:salicylate hydroxylase
LEEALMGKPLRVAVIGGGIGGLTAALALHRRGVDVTVFEQAPELGEVGAGVMIQPNGARILERLGLGDELTGSAHASARAPRTSGWTARRWGPS